MLAGNFSDFLKKIDVFKLTDFVKFFFQNSCFFKDNSRLKPLFNSYVGIFSELLHDPLENLMNPDSNGESGYGGRPKTQDLFLKVRIEIAQMVEQVLCRNFFKVSRVHFPVRECADNP